MLQLLAYSFSPVKSIPTTGSFPTTQAGSLQQQDIRLGTVQDGTVF
jgi:hypothetical protein